MTGDNGLSQAIYDHYSESFIGLSEDNRIALGSAFRLVHEVSEVLRKLNLLPDSTPIQGWQEAVGLQELTNRGYELRFEIWLAIGPVGQLAKLVEECEFMRPDRRDIQAWPEYFDIAILPTSQNLLLEKTIDSTWMQYLRRLSHRFQTLDDAIQKMPTSYQELLPLLFHCYLMAMSLHQAISILNLAELFANS